MRSYFASRYALCISVALALAACGGSQPPIGAPGAMPQSRSTVVIAGARYPVAHPTVLNFYSPHPLKFTVRQPGYDGRFAVSDSACGTIASVSPMAAKGPRATFKVTPIKTASGGSCVVSVADAQKHTAKVTVNNPGY